MAVGHAHGDSPIVEPVVALSDVVSAIGNFPVLAGLTLTVDVGEIVLLRGANGAGKTSLLRLCAGFLPVTRGSATVCGIDLGVDARLVGRSVGLLGHKNGLYLDLSPAENLRFWGAAVGARPEESDAALTRVGIVGRVAQTPVRVLSAGQRRRTALACLLVRRARLWLLDEPHAGLDAASRDGLDEVLVQAASAGATVMLASHELDRAADLSGRVVTIEAGRVSDDTRTGDRAPSGAAEEVNTSAGDPAARVRGGGRS